MKVTLQVNGREMTFSEQELSSILEEHFSSKTTQKITTAKVVQKPAEGIWFEVKPQAIDQKIFEKERKNKEQEATRKLILEAFAEMKANPEKYGKNFKTMIPKKTWSLKTVAQIKEMASKLGDHNANWVEQALEWAQQIANGESWEELLCNNVNLYRLVVWKNGYNRLVGDFIFDSKNIHSSYFYDYDFDDSYSLGHTVPLVVSYE